MRRTRARIVLKGYRPADGTEQAAICRRIRRNSPDRAQSIRIIKRYR
jgi:hypothetical protein